MRLLALAACAALIAGCGSSSNDKSSGTTSGTTTKAATPAAGSGGGVTIKAAGFAFSPSSVTVKKGEKVTWVNSDPAPHNVTSKDGTLKSPDFAQGKSFTYTATKDGTFSYICTIHPQMKATLIVTG